MQYYTEYELTTSRKLAEPLLNRELERRRVAAERREETDGRPASRGAFARLVAWATGESRPSAARTEKTTTGPCPQLGEAR